MLSKLRYFKKYGAISVAQQAECTEIMAAFATYYESKGYPVCLSAGPKGTLGITFVCNGLPTGPCFVKTHFVGEDNAETLLRESMCLHTAYGDELKVETVQIIFKGKIQVYLKMPLLRPVSKITPSDVVCMIKDYQRSFSEIGSISKIYDISELQEVAKNELKILYGGGVLF